MGFGKYYQSDNRMVQSKNTFALFQTFRQGGGGGALTPSPGLLRSPPASRPWPQLLYPGAQAEEECGGKHGSP